MFRIRILFLLGAILVTLQIGAINFSFLSPKSVPKIAKKQQKMYGSKRQVCNMIKKIFSSKKTISGLIGIGLLFLIYKAYQIISDPYYIDQLLCSDSDDDTEEVTNYVTSYIHVPSDASGIYSAIDVIPIRTAIRSSKKHSFSSKQYRASAGGIAVAAVAAVPKKPVNNERKEYIEKICARYAISQNFPVAREIISDYYMDNCADLSYKESLREKMYEKKYGSKEHPECTKDVTTGLRREKILQSIEECEEKEKKIKEKVARRFRYLEILERKYNNKNYFSLKITLEKIACAEVDYCDYRYQLASIKNQIKRLKQCKNS